MVADSNTPKPATIGTETDQDRRAVAADRSLKSLFVPRPFLLYLVQGGGILAILWAASIGNVATSWWVLAFAVYFLTSCLGMAITVHRSLAHRAFRLARPLELVFLFMGAMGGTGSPLAWIAIHRTHHATADTAADPHSPINLGWKILYLGSEQNFGWWRVRDILRDPFQRFLHRYYVLFLAGWAVLLAAIHPLAVVFGFLIPACAQITVTNLSTILGHSRGYRNFDTRDESTNNVLIAVLAWGEGWHNNHHADPNNWTLQSKIWEIDPAALIIRLLVLLRCIAKDSFAVANSGMEESA